MLYTHYSYPDDRVSTTKASFLLPNGIAEYHVQFQITDSNLPYSGQVERLHRVYSSYLAQQMPKGTIAVMKRYFLSDIANQLQPLKNELENITSCPTSFIQQPPLDGTKIALWCYFVNGMEVVNGHPSHNGYTHYWNTENYTTGGNSQSQMTALLKNYEDSLVNEGLSFADDCLRTWIFVQNIDANYQGVVKGRRKNFEEIGLTPETHFIASTGIEGRYADSRSLVTMDAYTVKGLMNGQKRYLYALSHLNPTYEYGVTFERGTAIEYGDRKHILISGTASINNKGKVLYANDVISQAKRMCENVETLLAEGGASFNDVAMAIVYLRDIADYRVVRTLLSQMHPDLPCQFVLASVCRPTWLIEMECIAITKNNNPLFTAF